MGFQILSLCNSVFLGSSGWGVSKGRGWNPGETVRIPFEKIGVHLRED